MILVNDKILAIRNFFAPWVMTNHSKEFSDIVFDITFRKVNADTRHADRIINRINERLK